MVFLLLGSDEFKGEWSNWIIYILKFGISLDIEKWRKNYINFESSDERKVIKNWCKYLLNVYKNINFFFDVYLKGWYILLISFWVLFIIFIFYFLNC